MTTWLTPREIHTTYRLGLNGVREALAKGVMHGHQPTVHGRWRVTKESVDAYIAAAIDDRARESEAACTAPQCVRRRAEAESNVRRMPVRRSA